MTEKHWARTTLASAGKRPKSSAYVSRRQNRRSAKSLTWANVREVRQDSLMSRVGIKPPALEGENLGVGVCVPARVGTASGEAPDAQADKRYHVGRYTYH